jgi:RNA polymerase sigma-32 factor
MARTATLPILNGESGLSRYLAEIRKFPMLEPQQEYMLAKRLREHDDRDAAHQLVTSHLRLVAKIAMGYRGYGLPISEVVSEGNVGLMQAVKRFEPEKGFRLATYAMWWIKASIQVHPAFLVARENGHHREPEEAVLQPAQGQEQDLRARRG